MNTIGGAFRTGVIVGVAIGIAWSIVARPGGLAELRTRGDADAAVLSD